MIVYDKSSNCDLHTFMFLRPSHLGLGKILPKNQYWHYFQAHFDSYKDLGDILKSYNWIGHKKEHRIIQELDIVVTDRDFTAYISLFEAFSFRKSNFPIQNSLFSSIKKLRWLCRLWAIAKQWHFSGEQDRY